MSEANSHLYEWPGLNFDIIAFVVSWWSQISALPVKLVREREAQLLTVPRENAGYRTRR